MASIPALDVATLKKLSPVDLTLLWVNDFEGGPLEAVVEHEGKRCLMVLSNPETAHLDGYRWIVFELTREESVEEEKWHALFAENIGEHWCFHDGAITHPRAREEPKPETFYAAYKARAPLAFAHDRARGWTDEMPKR